MSGTLSEASVLKNSNRFMPVAAVSESSPLLDSKPRGEVAALDITKAPSNHSKNRRSIAALFPASKFLCLIFSSVDTLMILPSGYQKHVNIVNHTIRIDPPSTPSFLRSAKLLSLQRVCGLTDSLVNSTGKSSMFVFRTRRHIDVYFEPGEVRFDLPPKGVVDRRPFLSRAEIRCHAESATLSSSTVLVP